MDDKFIAGAMLGMLGGALIAANSVKARQMIKDGQNKVMETAEKTVSGAKQEKKKSKSIDLRQIKSAVNLFFDLIYRGE